MSHWNKIYMNAAGEKCCMLISDHACELRCQLHSSSYLQMKWLIWLELLPGKSEVIYFRISPVWVWGCSCKGALIPAQMVESDCQSGAWVVTEKFPQQRQGLICNFSLPIATMQFQFFWRSRTALFPLTALLFSLDSTRHLGLLSIIDARSSGNQLTGSTQLTGIILALQEQRREGVLTWVKYPSRAIYICCALICC